MSENDPVFDKAEVIARLNDEFRANLLGGVLVMTPGVHALAKTTQLKALQAIRDFSEFTPDYNPYGHHDFGEINTDDHRLWWKIDCYDKDLRFGSPNPCDPSVTTRVMTVLLPSEY